MLSLLPLVAIALLFWLLLIRPAAAPAEGTHADAVFVEGGDEVMLTSGIFGTLRETGDDAVQVEIADGVTVKVVRGAVGQVVQQPEATEPGPEEN